MVDLEGDARRTAGDAAASPPDEEPPEVMLKMSLSFGFVATRFVNGEYGRFWNGGGSNVGHPSMTRMPRCGDEREAASLSDWPLSTLTPGM